MLYNIYIVLDSGSSWSLYSHGNLISGNQSIYSFCGYYVIYCKSSLCGFTLIVQLPLLPNFWNYWFWLSFSSVITYWLSDIGNLSYKSGQTYSPKITNLPQRV